MTKKEKLLQSVARKSSKSEASASGSSVLAEQYRVIRKDLMKLRDDLTRGYSIARDMYGKKTLVKDLMKLR
jgi:ABC-type phosphate transport system auxiliary subunit